MNTIKQIKQVKDTAKLIFSFQEINSSLDLVANQINIDYQDRQPIFLCVVLGGITVFGHLMNKLNIDLETDYIHATRYNGEIVGKELTWKTKPGTNMSNRDIIVVDDILDGGITLQAIVDFCDSQGASSVTTCVLLDKSHHRDAAGLPKATYTALKTNKDEYFFGFGMDYHNYLRNANGIYAVNPELLKKNTNNPSLTKKPSLQEQS